MSYELINRITVKKDGVYVSSHSNNDTAPFHSHRIKTLSEVYANEGQKGLDREIIRMLYEYAELRGNHKSLDRYRYVFTSYENHAIYKKYRDAIDEFYDSLSEEDEMSLFGAKLTNKAKEYRVFERNMQEKMYSEIANICEEYDKLSEKEKEKWKSKYNH